MTDLPFDTGPEPTSRSVGVTVRRCLHPKRDRRDTLQGQLCTRCGRDIRPDAQRRGRNNRKRGGKAELDVARAIGGEKVGPLGHPWDVTIPGYARLQVRKYANPQSLRAIAAELRRIAQTPGPEQPGYVWLEPGRNGEQLIVFRLREFTQHHGEIVGGEAA